MTGWSNAEIWLIIAVMAVGTFLIRFSFLGLFGGRDLPDWALRHLRYTAVGILPALVTPLVLWPEGPGSDPDPIRIISAGIAILAGCLTRNANYSIIAGLASFGLLQLIFA